MSENFNFGLIFLIFFISCGVKTEELEKEIDLIGKELTKKQKERIRLQEDVDYYSTKVKECINRKNTEDNFNIFLKRVVPKEYLFVQDKKYVFSKIYDSFRLDVHNFERGLRASYFYNSLDNESLTSQDKILIQLINNFDRRASNLKSFFNDDTIEVIVGCLNATDDVNTSYLYNYLDMMGYSDFETSEDVAFLDELYMLLEQKGWESLEVDSLIDEFRVVHSGEPSIFEDSNDSWGNDKENKGLYRMYYSFWARRQHEGNKKVVYEIFSKIKNGLKK